MDYEQADAGRDDQTRLAGPDSQARKGTAKKTFFSVQLATSKIGNLTRLIHTLLYVMTVHILNRVDATKTIVGGYNTFSVLMLGIDLRGDKSFDSRRLSNLIRCDGENQRRGILGACKLVA